MKTMFVPVLMLGFLPGCGDKPLPGENRPEWENQTSKNDAKPASPPVAQSIVSPAVTVSRSPDELLKQSETIISSGPGKDRSGALSALVESFGGKEWQQVLSANSSQLLDEDAALLSYHEDKIAQIDSMALLGIIETAGSDKAARTLLSILGTKIKNQQLNPSDVLSLADNITNKNHKWVFLQDTLSRNMERDPVGLIGQMHEVFRSLDPKITGPGKEIPGQTDTSRLIMRIAENTPSERRNEAWETALATDNNGISALITNGIFSGQLARNSRSASEWLNTIQPGPAKSSAVRLLVSHLLINGDVESADAWVKSASEYLTVVDKKNIEIFYRSYRQGQ